MLPDRLLTGLWSQCSWKCFLRNSMPSGVPWSGWRRWGSATRGCLPECLGLVVSRLGVRWPEGTHPHSEPQARSLLCHLILREYICLSDPQFPHLYYEEVELVRWIPKYHMEEKKKMEVL